MGIDSRQASVAIFLVDDGSLVELGHQLVARLSRWIFERYPPGTLVRNAARSSCRVRVLRLCHRDHRSLVVVLNATWLADRSSDARRHFLLRAN